MKKINKTIIIFIILKLSLCFITNSQQINQFQKQLQNQIRNSEHELEYNRNQLIEGVEIFQKYLSGLENDDQNRNIQLHRCTAKKRQKCHQFAKQLIEQCYRSDSRECWRKVTLEYPKCLRCYCPFVVAKTCQASNFIVWLVYNVAVRNGCVNILQKQCRPLVLGIILQIITCKWCYCLAQKRGYETYFDCPNEYDNLMQLLTNQYLTNKKIEGIQN